MKRYHPIACCILTLAAACGPGDAPAPAEGAPPAQEAAAPAAGGAPAEDVADVTRYVLRMDKVRSWAEAKRNVARATAADPALGDLVGTDAKESIDAQAARLDGAPALRSAITAAGLSSREYTVLNFAILQSMMAESMIANGTPRDSVLGPMQIREENVQFVRDNKPELMRLMRGEA